MLRKIIVEKAIDPNIKVKWFMTLDATYVHCKVT